MHDHTNEFSGTEVTLQTLIDLRHIALHQLPARLKNRLAISGIKLSTIRGRGIEFDSTREYQAGDDIRNMAWRVTARSLKPHIKVYREEKERHVWLGVDLSPSLYFGTRRMFKSVKSIMQATIAGWSALQKHERVGAVIGTEQKPHLFLPQASENNYLAILNSLAEYSRMQPLFDDKHYLKNLLLSLQQHVRSGNIIYLFSDFYEFNAETEKLILYLAQRAHIILNFIYDPFEALPPPPHQYLLTNGQHKMLFNMHDAKNRDAYRLQFQKKLNQLMDFARKHQLSLNLYCTDPEREVNP
jgi:uncharacterized protein (DUF58 family)